MPKHVVDLLTNLGLPAEDAVKIDALPEAEQATFDVAPYAEKVAATYKTKFENDPTFFSDKTIEKLPPEINKRIEAAQFARASGIMKSKILKGLGMTEADLGELTEEQREKLDPFIGAIIEKYTKTKAGDKELQQQLIEARKQLEKYGPDYEKGIETKFQTESEKKVTSAIFNAALIGELSSIPGLKIAATDIAKTANDILQGKYAFERVGDFAVELRQKANPAMKVLKNNSSQELTLKEALIDIATERGWIEKEKEKGTGGGVITITPQNGTLNMVAPHLQDKISKKIAEEGK